MTKQPNTVPAIDRRSPSADSGGHFHAVSLSGGKDSSYLLLRMIELGMPIGAVISADTGMEFPEMYDHLAKLDDHLYRERGIHITTLRHPKGFEYLMFDEPKQKPSALERRARLGVPPYGNGWPRIFPRGLPRPVPYGLGWPGIRQWGPHKIARFCGERRSKGAGAVFAARRKRSQADFATTRGTGQLKTHLILKEVNRLKAEKNAVHFIGIAADEAWRCKDERYPLVEWGVTEADALQVCYDRGFDFGGVYRIYRRVSCWCCPFQRISELRALRKHHPELWERLRDMDDRARAQFGPGPLGQFKKDWSVERLEERFAREEAST